MSTKSNEKLKFPSGRSIYRLKQDAKALARTTCVPLHEALDEVAKANGMTCGWSQAIHSTQKHLASSSRRIQTDLNPYRKLLVLGLNELLEKRLISLDWDGKSVVAAGHIETIVAGHQSIVLWSDAGFGEIRMSVWWKYDHSQHPQANYEGNSRERFSTASPLAKRQHYPKFVGVVCSAWLERDTGNYLQGNGQSHIIEKYARRGELDILKKIPNPEPLGYQAQGRFHM